MNKTIGFIGCGNMAKAMIGGLIKSNLVPLNNIVASAKSKETLEKVEKEFNIRTALDNKKVAEEADYLILAVKPYMYENILKEIKNSIKKDAVIISIAVGITIDTMRLYIEKDNLIVRTMPNTPSLVGEGISALSFDREIKKNLLDEILSIFHCFGKAEILDESLMNGFSAVCGSSPAFVYMMIEAMADAAVIEGIPRKQAYSMVSQAVLGSAKMVLETGAHPGELKDNVCSPRGTTIEGVAKLEELGFRSSIIEAIRATSNKSKSIK